jgi:hypothetical protein
VDVIEFGFLGSRLRGSDGVFFNKQPVNGPWIKLGILLRLVDLRYGLTGRISNGMLFRVSLIDPTIPTR